MKESKLLLPGSLLLAILVSDQLTKFWAVANLTQGSLPVFGDFFRLTLVYNKGGAMGTNVGSPTMYLILALVILPVLIYYIWSQRESYTMSIPLAMIAGGAVGNLVDRIRVGQVIDFLDVDFFDIDLFGYQLSRWWTFNLADAAISCAIVFLVVYVGIKGQGPMDKTKLPTMSAPET